MIYGQPITFGGASGEISITENGTFDVKKYATANVNVEPVLLWQNASPTSNFAPQSVNVERGYTRYITRGIYGTNFQNDVSYDMFFDETSSYISCPRIYGTNTSWPHREVTFEDGRITFGAGFDGTLQNSGYVIPTHIWGIKFTLK